MINNIGEMMEQLIILIGLNLIVLIGIITILISFVVDFVLSSIFRIIEFFLRR